MSSTEVFTSHTTVSGKVTLMPEFFDGWLFTWRPGSVIGNYYMLCNPTSEMIKFARQIDKQYHLKQIAFISQLEPETFKNCNDFLTNGVKLIGGTSCYDIPAYINAQLKTRNIICEQYNCDYTSSKGYNYHSFKKIITINFPVSYVSEPHVSFFETSNIKTDISNTIETRTTSSVTFCVIYFYGGWGDEQISMQLPTEPIYLHWQATGPIASAPTENLLD
jgi:hypothetical protein